MSEQDNFFDEAFNKQDELKKEAKNAKGNKGTGNFEYQEIKYEGLNPGINVVFRPIGIPFEKRSKNTDTKFILHSKILNDNGKTFSKINWKSIIEDGKYKPDPEWIFTKLYKAVHEATWVKFTDEDVGTEIKGQKIKKDAEGKILNERGHNGYYNDIHKRKPSYIRLKNNKRPNDTFENKIYPAGRVILQIISRMDSWCKDNKHYKILSTKVGSKDYTKEDGSIQRRFFPDTGISYSLYLTFIEYFRKFRKNWNTDFIIRRYQANDKWTESILDASLKDRVPSESASLIVDTDLTEEEKSYDFYDLDKLFKITSAIKLKKNFIKLFKMVDVDLNTNFTEELERLVKIEEEENKTKEVEVVKTEVSSPIETPVETKIATPVGETKVDTRSERKERSNPDEPPFEADVKVEAGGDIGEILKKVFPHWDDLGKYDKEDMEEFFDKLDGNQIIFKDTPLVPCENKNCEQLLPSKVQICPKCGQVF